MYVTKQGGLELTFHGYLCHIKISYIIINVLLALHAGRGFGSFVGGFLIADIGAREAFRMMGYMAAVGGVVYGILHAFWLRHLEITDPNKELPAALDAEQPGKNLNHF